MSFFYQEAFDGGMNILENDTRLKTNQYRLALNLRNRFGKLVPIANGVEDEFAPTGIKQEIRTFGNYVILFVAGYCYYRLYSDVAWELIPEFKMSSNAPRYWTEVVPLATINHLRKLSSATDLTTALFSNVSGAAGGNNPGLVVQDNINQPMLIFINPATGAPTSRVLQSYDQWSFVDGGSGVLTSDKREYVPIGNSMAWVDGILWIASQDGEILYRSVTGRPLDFVVNIDINGVKGGNANTTAYSVGVGGITTLRAMSSNALFVAASNANFAVSKNTSINALVTSFFGEPTFIRTFLFNAVCVSDRAIIDSLGDTKFIDVTGLRSFNAVQQLQNEGRNSSFSMLIQAVFHDKTQLPNSSAAILYDNYEFYAVDTTLGPVIAVYDTINQCWTAFDTQQTGGSLVKMFSKIELTIQRLYAITVDNKIYTLFSGNTYAPMLRTLSVSPDTLLDETYHRSVPQDWEHKFQDIRCLFSGVTVDETASVTVVPQNEVDARINKNIIYTPSALGIKLNNALDDLNTNLKNVLFSFPNCRQACQTYCIIEWTGNVELAQFFIKVNDTQPMNPLRSQS